MGFSTNPFLQRVSEKTSSDEDFVRLFSPKILDRLPEAVFEGGVHVFLSPPGGGKTMLLRAFTPTVLRAFWYNKSADVIEEASGRLVARGILDPTTEPRFLGVMLSCAFGYADLPPGAGHASHGLFRALFNCRVVLRSLRSLVRLLGTAADTEVLRNVHLDYEQGADTLVHIPRTGSAFELLEWAESTERMVYAELDSLTPKSQQEMPSHLRLESVLWLQQVAFVRDGAKLSIRRMLMIDDMHKLRDAQAATLREELIEIRPSIPVWLAQRTIALGPMLLSPGARNGRDVTSHRLDELWKDGRGPTQFAGFAESILDRRMREQQVIPSASFVGHIAEHAQEVPRETVQETLARLGKEIGAHARDPRFAEWVQAAEEARERGGVGAVRDLYKIRIRISRQERKRQGAFDFEPLPVEDLEDGESGKDDAAAELFMHQDLKLPYYFGSARLYKMATNNAEELLALGGRLFDRMRALRVLRKEPILSPTEQEKIFTSAATERLEFIPKSHTEGARARNLLKGIGSYCHERTYLPSASYAPGVTGVRLSNSQLQRLKSNEPAGLLREINLLRRVLSECVAENLLFCDLSEASGSREAGTIFWLNRLFCVEFSLPLQKGCWQPVEIEDMIEWMRRGPAPVRNRSLEID